MHSKTTKISEAIRKLKGEMLEDGWNAQRDIRLLRAQLTHLKKCQNKMLGGEWTGSLEDDVDDEFRDIKEPEYQVIDGSAAPRNLPRKSDSPEERE